MLLIGVAGPSGTGKTHSLRNLPAEETFIIIPSASKTVGIPGWRKKYKTLSKENPQGNLYRTPYLKSQGNKKGLPDIVKYVNEKRTDIKYLVIEDTTHFQNARRLTTNFISSSDRSKWASMGNDVSRALIPENYIENLRDDLNIIIMYHVESDADQTLKIKTAGNFIDKIDIPSYYDYFFFTSVGEYDAEEDPGERYRFVTNNDGLRQARSPYGCFEDLYVPNDILPLIERIREFENDGE